MKQDLTAVKAQVKDLAAALNAAYPDDAALVADMLEGETDLHEVAGRIIADVTEAEEMAEACKALADIYKSRAAALKARSERQKAALGSLVQATGLKSLRHAYATVSVRPSPRSVVLSCEAEDLPAQFQRHKVEADKSALKAALEAGERIEGAALSNGGVSTSIRRA